MREDAAERAEELPGRHDEPAWQRQPVREGLAEVRGSGAEQVQLAREHLERARRSADEAVEFAARANEAAADAHDRAAAVNETLAGLDGADGRDYTGRAASHRLAAREDRAAAETKRAARERP